MHISEGVLSGSILLSGGVLTAVGTAIGLKKMDYDKVMSAALLAAAFFVASLIHVPIGPSSVHLIMNGLLGMILGWAAFPAILVGLLLQSVLFQFGGISVLGVNTFNMAAPAVLCFYLFKPRLTGNGSIASKRVTAFACGFVSVFLGTVLTALSLAFTDEGFVQAARVLAVAHLPVMVIEGFITMFAYFFLVRVRPEVLVEPGRNK